jgi:exportin-T
MMRNSPYTSCSSSVRLTKVSHAKYSRRDPSINAHLAGTKGRGAFCVTPVDIAKEKRKETDYSSYPLTKHGEMLYALVQSGIAGHPHKTVTMQFFETVARYGDFFKVRKDCIVPALQSMVGPRYVH